jgi:hypothetical protein
MYVRVVRFTDVDPKGMAERQSTAEEAEGPPEGVPATGIQIFHDSEQRTAIVVQHFATEETWRPARPSSTRWTRRIHRGQGSRSTAA